MAASKAKLYDEIFKRGRLRATIEEEVCTACGNCLKTSGFRAVKSKDSRFWIDDSDCVGCELCFNMCPVDAIKLTPEPTAGKY